MIKKQWKCPREYKKNVDWFKWKCQWDFEECWLNWNFNWKCQWDLKEGWLDMNENNNEISKNVDLKNKRKCQWDLGELNVKCLHVGTTLT